MARIRSLISDRLPAIIDVLTERAMAGDTGAARLLLERTVAPLKASEEPAPLALVEGTVTERGMLVVKAVADGRLSPSQGSAFLSTLVALSKLRESDELEDRVAALEAREAR